MKVMIHNNPEAIGEHLATRILTELRAANAAGRPYVLGCPGGRSPMPVYQALERQLAANPVDCSGLIVAMMDEYLLSGPDGLSPPPASAHYSCRGFGEREIVGRINRALPAALRMPEVNFRMPSLAAPETYDAGLASLGGIDLFLLASGAGDGHIAFNPPGSMRDSRSRIVTLAEQTRRDNLATFPDFHGLDEVPTHGLTIGTGSIANLSKAVAMIVWGEGKREAFRRLSTASGYDPGWPATIAVECRNAELHADAAAGAVP
ncbi:6-phosphogluconolactonase [Shinella sp. CPCC 100929]|uniref:6-phosphogluconolactonase n=1 Tax=Shinella lacus TaxID=2654216 RepID=A0ABT1R4W0_9HYPH|nr:6-phosphogluconolactonase [Shinella lacus]MCQ4630220.1 6-phosphogluconolactonase [Shinella lacus]